jgi:hypothetical protein
VLVGTAPERVADMDCLNACPISRQPRLWRQTETSASPRKFRFRFRGLRRGLVVVMSTLFSLCVASLIAAGLFAGAAFAGKPVDQASEHKKEVNERTVFVTGSLIPQRIKLKPIGTTTVSPVRIIDRREIDATGRRATRGVLIADPSVRVIGH